MSFKDRVVLITGGSSGIGAAIAIKFAGEGANVAIVGRNESKLKNVSVKCEQAGRKPLVIVADVTIDDDVKRIISTTIDSFGKLDVLVNNAGILGGKSIVDQEAMLLFDKIMTTNLRSVVYLTNLSASHLVETKGNIINMSSISGLGVQTPTNFAYATSKAALDHFTRCIALELAPKGVRVNSVNPGPVKTDIVENIGVNKEHQDMIWNMMKKGTALDRIGEADEIADLVVFLASEKARSITGSTFVTDNGTLLKGAYAS